MQREFLKLIEFMSIEIIEDLCEYVRQNDSYLHAPFEI